MKKCYVSILCALLVSCGVVFGQVDIISYGNGGMSWSNETDAVFTVEWASSLLSPDWTNSWTHLVGITSTGNVVEAAVPMFYRVNMSTYSEVTNQAECYVLYSNALLDAKVALPSEISTELWAISTNTPGTDWRMFTNWVDFTTGLWVRVAVMKYAGGWSWDTLLTEGPVTMTNGYSAEIWITVYPQLFNLCAGYSGDHQTLRIQKALGLPPRSGTYGVAELFIDPKYLFRPAPDMEINDASAGLADGPNAPYITANSFQGRTDGYTAWYAATYNSRGYDATNDLDNCWPWTRMGYTYDYANVPTRPYGLSEFVIVDPAATNYWGEGLTVPFFVVTKTNADAYGH